MHLTATAPARLDGVTLRLARLDSAGSRACIQAGFAASTAYISLSPGLVCMFGSPSGTGLTHQDIGAAGFSAHQLWNAAAAQLTEKAQRPHGAEFLVRCLEFAKA